MNDKDKAEVNNLKDIIDAASIIEDLYKEVADEVNNNKVVVISKVGNLIYEAGAKMLMIGERLGAYDHTLERYGQLVKLQVDKDKT